MAMTPEFHSNQFQIPVLVPVMTVEAFAAACGLPIGVIGAQVERGYWKTVKVGKYRFINVAALWQQCAVQEY